MHKVGVLLTRYMSQVADFSSNTTNVMLDTKMSHVATELPDTAIMHCKAGLLAAKASQKQEAIDSFYSALSIEPLLWEAWLGLCNLGQYSTCILVSNVANAESYYCRSYRQHQ